MFDLKTTDYRVIGQLILIAHPLTALDDVSNIKLNCHHHQ